MIVRSKRSLEQIRALISDGQIEAAADCLLLIVREQSVRNQIYLFAGDWKDTKHRYNGNLLDFATYKAQRNRVVLGFFENILPSIENNFQKERADQLMGAGLDKFHEDDFEGSLVDFEAILHLFPHDPEALLHRGIVRNRLGRVKEALSDFDEVVEREKYNVHALVCRGSLFMAMGENEKACTDWRNAKEYVFEKCLENSLNEMLHNFCSCNEKIKNEKID